MLKLKKISPSRIKTFDTCLFKYWLTYNCTDVELKSNFGALHGSLVHDVLENYSNGNDTNFIGRLLKGYNGTLETLDRYQKPEVMESPLVLAKEKDYANKKPECDTCPHTEEDVCGISKKPLDNLPGCPKYLFDNSVSMVENVISSYQDVWPKVLKNKEGVIIGCEYGFDIPVLDTDVNMNGYMDLVIEENEDTVHVIDYKAGNWTQNYDQCRDDIQARMYSLASRRIFIDDCNQKGFNYKNVILTFDYFTANPITVVFSEEEDLETEKEVKDKILQIQSTEYIYRIMKDKDAKNNNWHWKCKYICDTKACQDNWQGRFRVNG